MNFMVLIPFQRYTPTVDELSEYDYLDQVLPGFSEARQIIKANGDSVKAFSFLGDKFEFYRFANRYRMAVRFQSIRLEGFGDATEAGYSALTRAFFAWSVFERYTDLCRIHCPYGPFFSHIPKIELSKLAQVIDRADPEYRLFDHLRSQSLPQNQDQLDRFRSGDRKAVVFYASAIRHIYVHGHLTANPNKCASENVQTICHAISDFLLDGIKDDFQRRLKVAKADG